MKNSWFLQTLFGSAALALLGCSNAAAQSSSIPPQDRFLPSVALSQHVTAEPALAHRLQSQSRTAISVAGGNFFGDANRALVTGYAVGSGGAIAVQRGSAQLPRPGEIDGVEPFSQNATFVDLGMRPDFLVSADMNQDGHRDLIVATRGGSQVMVLEGDGHGGFAPQAPFSVNGRIVGIEPWRDASGTQQIAAAVCRQSCSVDFYQASGTRLRSIPIDDTVTILKIARLNGGAADDIVAGGASNLAVIDGSSALTAQPRVDRLPVWGALAAATGEFVYDARDMMQIAVLTEDGSIHTLARSGVISTPPLPNPNARRLLHNQQRPQRPSIDPKSLAWIDVETLPGVATFDGSATPLLVRTRASGSGMDDLLVLNANGNRITTVRHPVVAYPPSSANPYAGTLQALPARVETGATPAGAALAAIPIRTSQDARLGLVTVSGGVSPAFAELPASRTLNVTTTADAAVTSSTITACENGGTCSLRSALAVVDSDATANETDGNADTVNVPVGTYTLGNNGPEEPGSPNPDQYGDPQYHIEIYGPVNLIGANTGTTIITTNNNDKIFSENSGNATGDNNLQPPIDAWFSGFTLFDGTNPSSGLYNTSSPYYGQQDGNGGLMDGDTGGTGNITFINCNFISGTDIYGPGGGIYISDEGLQAYNQGFTNVYYPQGTGTLEVSGGTFSGNQTDEEGGAISAGYSLYANVPIDVVGVTFTSNSANGGLTTNDPSVQGAGGAIYQGAINPTQCEGDNCTTDDSLIVPSYIENSNFTSNAADYVSGGLTTGGGAVYARSGITITGNTFGQNTANGSAPADQNQPDYGMGGAIYILSSYEPAVITGNVFSKNGATVDGGAIWIDGDNSTNGSPSQAATIRYNVFYDDEGPGGTTTPVSGRTGLAVGFYTSSESTDTQATVTATDNFWGCNGAATGTGCDVAGTNASNNPLIVSPYAEVTASLNTTTPATGSSIILTGGITQDSNGTSLAGNEGAFAGLPIALTLTQNGSSLGSSDTSLNASGSASLSTTATAGNGAGTVTLDSVTITVNFTGNPIVTGISPNSGPGHGGTIVIISGSSFTGASHVYFGGTAAASFTVNSDTQITATSPSGAGGMVNITVVTSAGTSATSTADQFTFTLLTPAVMVTSQSSVNSAQPLPVTVSVSGGNGNPTPTGSVTLSSGTYTSSPAALTSGSANIIVPAGALAVGSDTLTAAYSGDPNYSTATGTSSVTVVQAIGSCTTANPNPNPNPASFAAVSDFNGDCRSDILWRNNSTQQVYEWLTNGTTFTNSGSPGSLASAWVIQDAGDFNGDGMADILWRNSTTGEVVIWLMNGTTMTTSTSLGTVSSDWTIAGVGDFNGDGKADILWQNSSGEIYLWLMNGTTIGGGGIVNNISSGWNVAGIGDFNDDGMADILWRNSSTGQVYVWLMNGTTITSTGSPGTPTSDWIIAGVGDFDGNGTSDILWRNSTTGEVYLWFMSGTTFPSSGSIGYTTSDWSIQGVGDYDGSGRAGILWRNTTTEQVYIWLMNGTTLTSSGSPGTPDAAWQIQP